MVLITLMEVHTVLWLHEKIFSYSVKIVLEKHY